MDRTSSKIIRFLVYTSICFPSSSSHSKAARAADSCDIVGALMNKFIAKDEMGSTMCSGTTTHPNLQPFGCDAHNRGGGIMESRYIAGVDEW